MGCGCADKPKLQRIQPSALTINCQGCGITRLLPDGLQLGDTVKLAPCPKCGVGFIGTFTGNQIKVEE